MVIRSINYYTISSQSKQPPAIMAAVSTAAFAAVASMCDVYFSRRTGGASTEVVHGKLSVEPSLHTGADVFSKLREQFKQLEITKLLVVDGDRAVADSCVRFDPTNLWVMMQFETDSFINDEEVKKAVKAQELENEAQENLEMERAEKVSA